MMEQHRKNFSMLICYTHNVERYRIQQNITDLKHRLNKLTPQFNFGKKMITCYANNVNR